MKQERLHKIALFLFLLVCYAYFFPRWADPNQNSRLDMVLAVVEDGTFSIDRYVENTVDYARVGDHYYSDKAPGAAFLGIPVYAALRLGLDLPVMDGLVNRLANNAAFQATLREGGSGILEWKVRFAIAQVVLAFLAGALPTAWIGVLLFVLAGKFTTWLGPRLAAALGYGLLTPAFAYAGAFYGHQLCAALLFSAFALVFLRRKDAGNPGLTSFDLAITGALLSYSVVTEYPAALASGILFLYTLAILFRQGTPWRIVWAIVPGGLVALGWMAYNTAVFGGPLSLGYSHSELWLQEHSTGFMSLTWPHAQAVWGITFSPFRGLFFYAPLLLLSIPGFMLWRRSGEHLLEEWVSISVGLAFFLFNASSIMWWGGFAIGPRYLLPALPFLALPLVLVFRASQTHPWLAVGAAVLGVWSLAATWGLALAGQAFPPDRLNNPLVEWALPHWQKGDVARSLGTLLGFQSLWSLLPLIVLLGLLSLAWLFLARRVSRGAYKAEERQEMTINDRSSTTGGVYLHVDKR